MICAPIRFGVSNQLLNANIVATPEPITEINWLKNEWRARQVVWGDPTQNIVIDGVLPEAEIAEYFSLPNSTLTGLAEVQLELFSTDTSETSIIEPEFVQLADLVPLGEWRAGIDPYGVPRGIDNPDVFVIWLDEPVVYQRFRLTIRHSDVAASAVNDVRLRMLMIGNGLQLEQNFSYGNQIQFLTEPDLVRTASGSHLPSRMQKRSRVLSMSFDSMTDSDRALMWRMEASLGGLPFLVSAYPEHEGWQFNNYTFLARFANALAYKNTFYDIHSVDNFVLVEV